MALSRNLANVVAALVAVLGLRTVEMAATPSLVIHGLRHYVDKSYRSCPGKRNGSFMENVM